MRRKKEIRERRKYETGSLKTTRIIVKEFTGGRRSARKKKTLGEELSRKSSSGV